MAAAVSRWRISGDPNGRWLAVGQIEHADGQPFGLELQDRPAHAEFGVVGVWGDNEDVEHGGYPSAVSADWAAIAPISQQSSLAGELVRRVLVADSKDKRGVQARRLNKRAVGDLFRVVRNAALGIP